jgi:hypothetical protein
MGSALKMFRDQTEIQPEVVVRAKVIDLTMAGMKTIAIGALGVTLIALAGWQSRWLFSFPLADAPMVGRTFARCC